ncbi:hypothetical protein [Nocardia sp. NPDC057227]|uniref:hypothetical protein n=1 Tax=Nocardia sp. NPDC057227 TaxID=3346056 RepID=UPI00362B2BEB
MYRLVPDQETFDQVAALPTDVLDDYLQLLSALELTPWNGEPQHLANPDGAVRFWLFGPAGAGQVIYLIDEPRRDVHLLRVQWLG